jgi:threonine dehydratase
LIPLEQIRSAQERLAGKVVRTPLLRLTSDSPPAIYLKLENLQPIGSFKLRGALNAISQLAAAELQAGVVTASAGNMGQGVAWAARELGVPCAVVVPEGAAETKLAAIERLGGQVVKVPYERWWQAIQESSFAELDGVFVHPVYEDQVMAGNGTIGLEILEDLSDPDAVLVPFGGGGLSVGIASAVKALRPETQVYAVEPETGAPLTASLAAGEPQEIHYEPSFVDGSVAVPIDETAAAVRLLAERVRVVAEGAGALSLAAALAGHGGTGNVVCVVSGGNIDSSKLATILAGETP